ncbi:MAG: diguanylate cyclase [Deltaproteobacteria bacterium]|jgi:diguanylate cyclase (GGDEF)-like protein|nr:diguanylate cyclase [Deltaproteobacteria bacterium]
MVSASPDKQSSSPLRFMRSLRYKLFLPFLVIIILLGMAATFSSVGLLKSSLIQSADDRLLATQEMLFREFKKQEIILQTYTVLLQHFVSLVRHVNDTEEVGILQDQLFTTLEESNISVAFYPSEIVAHLPQQSLVNLFDQAQRSKQPRFRYSNEFGDHPVLMVAAPLYSWDKSDKIMLLHMAMGDSFLHRIANPLGVKAILMNFEGKTIAQSHEAQTPISLTPAQINSISRGERVYLEQDHPGDGTQRYQISAIPLGSSELIFLSLQTPLDDAFHVQTNLILRLSAIIIAFLLLGTVIYFRIISGIISPAKQLQLAAERIAQGQFNHRIADFTNDEFGSVAVAFNSMLENLESNYQQRAAKDIEKVLEDEAIKTKNLLELKERNHRETLEELHNLQRETEVVFQLNQAMISTVELPSLFDRILQVIRKTLDCDHLVLLLYKPGESALEVVKALGIDEKILSEVKFTFDQGITGYVAETQRISYIKDLENDERSLSYHGQVASRGSMVSVPLVVKGRLLGVMNLHKKRVDSFSTSELKLIQAVANQTAVAVDNTQLLQRARNASIHDELTGLANRRYFQDILKREVGQARRFSSNFSLLMCDIDHFKQISQRLGPMRADSILRQVAQSLLHNTRSIDLVCRFSKEQFILLLPKTNRKGAVAAAEKLRIIIQNKQFDYSGAPPADLQVTVSFGVTEFPADSKNIYELLNLADHALFAAKKEGRNRTVTWEGPAPGPE